MLAPAGTEAADVFSLTIVLLAGSLVIWVAVAAMAVFASRQTFFSLTAKKANLLVLIGGVAFPILVVGSLLVYSLSIMPQLRTPGEGPTIRVNGERFWWRVMYEQDGQIIESANELRLPVGVRSNVLLESPDVIHSFWVPNLAGKMDVVPGRTTRLVLEPTKSGTFRGQCAEYCGASHAFMAFTVKTMEPDAFDAWLRQEAEDASPPETPEAREGRDIFLSQGCGACHTVRGTPARGGVGPDLTHVGARETVAAGTLPNTPEALRRFISHASEIKPEAEMPPFSNLGDEALAALAAYLESLE